MFLSRNRIQQKNRIAIACFFVGGGERFLRFKNDTKTSPLNILQGTHKYLNQIVNGDEEGPSNAAMIEIFNEFSPQPRWFLRSSHK